jgi:addiction module RelE/StbE family toxin
LRKSKIEWSDGALKNLEQIEAFIARKNPSAGSDTVLRIIERVESELTVFPSAGRPGRVDGTRELIFPDLPYIAVYAVRRYTVFVVRVFHTSQDFQRVARSIVPGRPER